RLDFKYDVFGNRLEKDVTTSSTVTTRFALDGWKTEQGTTGNRSQPKGNENWDVWADMDGSNALQTRYLRGDGIDQLFARVYSGAAAWYLTDIRGSVRNLTDSGGVLQDTIAYDGFGNITTESNSPFGDRYKFTAREYDAETKLQYNRARYYDPKIGRWIGE